MPFTALGVLGQHELVRALFWLLMQRAPLGVHSASATTLGVGLDADVVA